MRAIHVVNISRLTGRKTSSIYLSFYLRQLAHFCIHWPVKLAPGRGSKRWWASLTGYVGVLLSKRRSTNKRGTYVWRLNSAKRTSLQRAEVCVCVEGGWGVGGWGDDSNGCMHDEPKPTFFLFSCFLFLFNCYCKARCVRSFVRVVAIHKTSVLLLF